MRTQGVVPARVGRARAARALQLHRGRVATRLVRGGRDARRAGRRLPRLRRDRRVRADRAAAGGRAWRTGEPVPRPRRTAPLRPRARRRRAAARRCSRTDRRVAAPAPRLDAARAARARAVARGAPPPRRARAGAHPRGRRLPGRDRTARDPPDLGVGRRALPRAAARQSVAIPLSPRARRHRARGQLAGDGRQVRRPAGRAEPDRRDDLARGRRRGGAALVGEGPRRAHDARRPRAQRPLPRLRAWVGAGRALHGARALLARDASGVGGRRGAARRDHTVRAAPRNLPGRHRLGRSEGARDADHLGARAVPARDLRGRGGLPPSGQTGELDTCIAIRTLWLRDGVAHLQAGGGIVADSDPAAEHEECLAKLRALEAAIELAESEQDAAP